MSKGSKRRRKFKRAKKNIFGLPRLGFLLIVSFTLIVIASYIVINLSANPPSNGGELKVAILDSLYVMDPNESFLDEANRTLSDAGFDVDMYIGSDVTVELFKNLPSLGYKLIVLRVHTAYEPDIVAFFTGNYADSGYFTEQLMGWVRIGEVEGERFYAVTPDLIRIASSGGFQKSIVIVDSCYGLNLTSMAIAFIEKGASAYIAWDKGVYPNYSDNATLRLIDNLLEGMTVEEAIQATPSDPSKFGSVLSCYPDDGGDIRLIPID
ncbi:MAG: hypothetical protein HXX80_02880 [Nitrososphaerales archaeon]|nr:hypothetical protein [Nitrososphaerales archaeon]